MILNYVMAVILRYFTEVDSFAVNYVTVVEVRPTLSACDKKFSPINLVFTALHAMQTRSSDENSVRLSVCPSVRPSHACIVTKR